MSIYDHPIYDTTRHPAKDSGRLTILICTPDSQSFIFRRCYDSLMATTLGMQYDLMIVDNRNDTDFSHQKAINKAIDTADGPLLLLDDDCIVSGAWLQEMLAQLGAGVGTVNCAASNLAGQLRTRGATFTRDGRAVLYKGDVDGPIYVPCTGSFCMLLNLPKWPAMMRFSTAYRKYCFDPDLCLRLWECGLSTVTIPRVIIHESGGQMQQLHIDRRPLFEADQKTFKQTWITTGRINEVYNQYGHVWPEALREIK